jgi:hypothetical protein
MKKILVTLTIFFLLCITPISCCYAAKTSVFQTPDHTKGENTLFYFNRGAVEKQQITVDDALFIHNTVRELRESVHKKELIEKLRLFLNEKYNLSIPKISVKEGLAEEYQNILCYIYGTASFIGTIPVRALPICLIASLFPPLAPLNILIMALPRFATALSLLLCLGGKLECSGLLGQWVLEDPFFVALMLGFIGIKLWIPGVNYGVIFGFCVAISSK